MKCLSWRIRFLLLLSCLLLLSAAVSFSQEETPIQQMSLSQVLRELNVSWTERQVPLNNSETTILTLQQNLIDRENLLRQQEKIISDLETSQHETAKNLETSQETIAFLGNSLREIDNSLTDSKNLAQTLNRRKNFWRAVAIGATVAAGVSLVF